MLFGEMKADLKRFFYILYNIFIKYAYIFLFKLKIARKSHSIDAFAMTQIWPNDPFSLGNARK